MKRIIKLTERDLTRIVKRVINERQYLTEQRGSGVVYIYLPYKMVNGEKKVAKEVFRTITIQLGSKLNDVAFKEQLARYCIQKATGNEKDVELDKFTPSGGQSTQQFGQTFIDNVKATDFDVTFDSAGSDPKIIVHQKGKGTGNAYKLIQFRYRTDASASNKAGQKR